ncbi:hypothetical protein [Epibacterium ulvae]|uniref:Uncharacterized protein n=1 Tax=Epibacterium ulvae TaxID=1156985 RepID=A0A1G5PLQ5_9RHOB|nr:hypothetical protein [Epibacterium ulvae]SCZ50131.1 hypothetical protein SAMN04488118_101227 [Epibacterium ulvae]
MRVTHLFGAVFAICTSGFLTPAHSAPAGKALTVKAAGKLYGAICQNAYPDLKKAVAVAEANGFSRDQSTKLHEHPTLAAQLRIDAEVCNGRFHVRKGRDELPGAEFAEWSSEMIEPGAKPGKPHMKSAKLSANRRDLAVFRNR